jgi:hypothetical protein
MSRLPDLGIFRLANSDSPSGRRSPFPPTLPQEQSTSQPEGHTAPKAGTPALLPLPQMFTKGNRDLPH